MDAHAAKGPQLSSEVLFLLFIVTIVDRKYWGAIRSVQTSAPVVELLELLQILWYDAGI